VPFNEACNVSDAVEPTNPELANISMVPQLFKPVPGALEYPELPVPTLIVYVPVTVAEKEAMTACENPQTELKLITIDRIVFFILFLFYFYSF
jgi:hypothetical protein